MKIYTILIGNSDDKLTQKQWAEFIDNIIYWIKKFCSNIHFSGGSNCENPWQNYCIVFEVEESKEIWIKENLIQLRKKYKQDSIAWINGNTFLI